MPPLLPVASLLTVLGLAYFLWPDHPPAGTAFASLPALAAPPADANSALPSPSDDRALIPEWVPRPPGLLTASVEDTTRRSDGREEGTVHYTIAGDTAAAETWLRSPAVRAGLPGESADRPPAESAPSRFLAGGTVPLSAGGSRISLTYKGFSHAGGCYCPTCQPVLPSPSAP